MAQSLANLLIHLVFSTKNREPFILNEIQAEVHAYLGGICRAQTASAVKVGGVEDHVHLLVDLPRNLALCQLIKDLKASSSRWIKSKGAKFRQFSWQKGYGAFSVSESHREAVVDYIAQQKEHHRCVSFEDEFRQILQKNAVSYDERYVWE